MLVYFTRRTPVTSRRFSRKSRESLGTCVGLLGWADRLIVTTWRQWEGLMRNICFCVSTEPLIVRGKGYSAPIQPGHNENPSPPWAGWAYNIHPLPFSFPIPHFCALILPRSFFFGTYVTRFVPQIEETMARLKLKSNRATQSKHESEKRKPRQSSCLKLYANVCRADKWVKLHAKFALTLKYCHRSLRIN